MALPPPPGRHRDVHHLREGRRRRRHLAGQHLSGRRLRRAVAPVLALVRAERRLDPAVRRAAGDPRLPRRGRRRDTACARTSGFGTEVTARRASTRRRQLAADARRRRAEHEADVVVAGHRPAQPARASPTSRGSTSFEGTIFHSARWDHAHDLTGERVAVIGTGASAIQFVPRVPRTPVAHALPAQRHTCVPKPDRASPAGRSGLRPRAVLQRRTALASTRATRRAALGFAGDRGRRCCSRRVRAHLREAGHRPELRREAARPTTRSAASGS